MGPPAIKSTAAKAAKTSKAAAKSSKSAIVKKEHKNAKKSTAVKSKALKAEKTSVQEKKTVKKEKSGDDTESDDNLSAIPAAVAPVVPPAPVRLFVPLPASLVLPPLAAVEDFTAVEDGFDLTPAQRAQLAPLKVAQVANQGALVTAGNLHRKHKPMGKTQKAYLEWLVGCVVRLKRRRAHFRDFKAIAEAFNRKWHFEIENGSGNYMAKGWNNLHSVLLSSKKKAVWELHEDSLCPGVALNRCS